MREDEEEIGSVWWRALASEPVPSRLHTSVARWYALHARDLPWRRTRDPYALLVSEVMLQQTQVDRVVPKYLEFLKQFPTLAALAAASAGDVIRVWSPLGYNQRAVRLHRLAQRVVEHHGGRLPEREEELRGLPGLGPYTAAALACFAFGERAVVLDTNIYRVLSRAAYGLEPPSRREIQAIALAWLPKHDAAMWHQALMDIGAGICTTASPRCAVCPLRPHCRAAPVLEGGDRGLAEASVPYSPKQPAFAGSTRFYRGRIVDALRALPVNGSMKETELALVVRPDFDLARDADWFQKLLASLAADGLVRLEAAADAPPRVSLL